MRITFFSADIILNCSTISKLHPSTFYLPLTLTICNWLVWLASQDNFTIPLSSFSDFISDVRVTKKEPPIKSPKLSCLIILLLLVFGNIQPNQGPENGLSINNFHSSATNYQSLVAEMWTCDCFRNHKSFGLLHLIIWRRNKAPPNETWQSPWQHVWSEQRSTSERRRERDPGF